MQGGMGAYDGSAQYYLQPGMQGVMGGVGFYECISECFFGFSYEASMPSCHGLRA